MRHRSIPEIQTTLYLGRSMPAGGEVSEEQFDGFLDEVVTREFPAGLTVFDAYGQMQRQDGTIVKQSTKVILILHADSSEDRDAVSRVIAEYRGRFGEPQVAHTTQAVTPEFLSD